MSAPAVPPDTAAATSSTAMVATSAAVCLPELRPAPESRSGTWSVMHTPLAARGCPGGPRHQPISESRSFVRWGRGFESLLRHQ
jgi:hypothetical protein